MTCINDCSFCKHQHDEMKDGWIPTCDAFPDGRPFNLNKNNRTTVQECNNGIKFEFRDEESKNFLNLFINKKKRNYCLSIHQ